MIPRLRGRTPAEVAFRLRQEVANLLFWLLPPVKGPAYAPTPLPRIPSAEEQVDAVRDTPHAAEIVSLAEGVLAGQIPLLGYPSVRPGRPPSWRRDWVHGRSSTLQYQRLIPFLDFGRVGDHKVVWELSRHQHFVLLAQAYQLTGRREFLEELLVQWRDWISSNPFQCGIHWVSALEVGLRALSWIWTCHLCWGELPVSEILPVLRQHALYLEYNLSVHFSPNTHLLGEAVALHALGQFLSQDPRAPRWLRLGDQTVREQLERQVWPDGAHFEQSTFYQVYALDFFLLHYLLTGRQPAMRAALERMAGYLATTMGPARRLPSIGDDDGGRVFHPYGDREEFARATLATCAVLFNRPEWLVDSKDLPVQAAWWLGKESAGIEPAPQPAGGSQVFQHAGLVVLSNGPWWVLFDAGPFGRLRAGHSHSDTLSIVVRAGDSDILIDPGTYTYVADPALREAFRGTAAHNTIRVDFCDQAKPGGPFAWEGRPQVTLETATPRKAVADCVYDIHGGRVQHRRSLEVDSRRIVISDQLAGPEGEHLCEQFWHCCGCPQALSSSEYFIGQGVRLITGGPAALEPGWRSNTYGQKEAAQVVVVRRRGTFPLCLETVLEIGQ